MADASLRRDLGEYAVLYTSSTNVDGDFNIGTTLPPGFGDCELLEIHMLANSIATVLANPEVSGFYADLLDPASSGRDVVGVANWQTRGAAALHAWLRRDSLDIRLLWPAGWSIRLLGSETDTNATPTVDYEVFFRVRRLRNLPIASDEPLRFTS